MQQGTLVKSTFLINQTGSSNKVYNVYLYQLPDNSYELFGESGPNGGTLVRQDKAIKKGAYADFDTLVLSKINKSGYSVVSANNGPSTSGASSKTTNVTSARFLHGLQYVNSITEEHALELIESPFWVMQQKMDGERRPISITAPMGNYNIVAGNKKGDLVDLPSGITEGVIKLRLTNTDFDAEAVGDDLYIFDVLRHESVLLTDNQLGSRLVKLEEIENECTGKASNIHFVKTFWTAAEKRQAFKDIEAQGLEGVVFKLRASIYEAGKPNSGGPALKYRFLESTTVQVTDVDGSRSVGVSMLEDDKLISVGRVTVPSNFELPKLDDLLQVRYMYITNKGGKLIQPVLKAVRTDKLIPNNVSELKIKPTDQKLAA